jgi:hypothetical protein
MTSATTMAPEAPPGLLTRVQAAAWLCIHPRTLDRIASGGDLPVVRIGKRKLFRVEVLQDYARAHERRSA